MSESQPPQYGIREIDLTTARLSEPDFAQITTGANRLSILQADDEATIHLGDPTAPGIPVESLKSIKLDCPIGRLYISNEAGIGSLKIVLGVNVDVDTPDETTRPNGITSGSKTDVDGTADSLPTEFIPVGATLTIRADSGNSENVFIGDSITQVFPLEPGESIGNLNVSRTDEIYVKSEGTAGMNVYYTYEE